jgi:hypothetical protein
VVNGVINAEVTAPVATTSQLGIVKPDGTTITIVNGVISSVGGGSTGANPTATAGATAVNGVATTFMRSDGAPAVQTANTSTLGLVKPDGTTITIASGVISAVQQTLPVGANPTATAGATAINGSAATFMRSDGAPAVQTANTSTLGLVKPDGTTITIASGVISGAAAANPTATASNTAVNGVATTFMRSDAAPAVQLATTSVFGLVKPDGTTITISGGVISSTGGASGANPTATASNTAVNGVATTFMRSDAAPAVQLGSASVFGLVKVDGTTITASGGVISSTGGASGANPTATASNTAVNGVATTFMRSDAAPAVQLATTGVFGLVKPDGTTITIAGGVISAANGFTPTSFLATFGSASSALTGDATEATVIFPSTDTNVGSNYSVSTGAFTAPATGVYTFTTSLELNALTSSHTSFWCQFFKSTTDRFYIADGNPFAMSRGGIFTVHGSCTMSLNSGDTVSVHITVSNGTKVVTMGGGSSTSGRRSFFSGVRNS